MGAIAISDMGTRRPTQVQSSELALNGGFEVDLSNWTGPAEFTQSGGQMIMTAVGFNDELKQDVPPLTANKTYRYFIDVDSVSSGQLALILANISVENITAAGVYVGELTVGASPVDLDIGIAGKDGGGTTAVINTVSVKEFEGERFKLGPELWNDEPDVIEPGWEKVGPGEWKVDGSQGGNSEIKITGAIPRAGVNYLTEFEITEFTTGNARTIMSVDAGTIRDAVGFYSEALLSEADGGAIEIRVNVLFEGTIKNISFREQLAETIQETALTASDTLAYASEQSMVLILRNGSGGALTPKLDGADGALVSVEGVGSVDVSAGYIMESIADGAVVAIRLDGIKEFLPGVLTITGADGITATCIRF